jgi:GAF domain-containing protein
MMADPLARHSHAKPSLSACTPSLSVALSLQEAVVGALNIYASQPAVFDHDTIEMARTFAGYAAVAMANVRLYQSTATLAEDLRRAMVTPLNDLGRSCSPIFLTGGGG